MSAPPASAGISLAEARRRIDRDVQGAGQRGALRRGAGDAARVLAAAAAALAVMAAALVAAGFFLSLGARLGAPA